MCGPPLAHLLSVCVKRSHTRRNSSEQLSQASIQLTDTSNQPLINKIDQTFLWVFSLPEPHLYAICSLPRKDKRRRAEDEHRSCRSALTVYQWEAGDGPQTPEPQWRGIGRKDRSHWYQLHGILMQSQRVIINGPLAQGHSGKQPLTIENMSSQLMPNQYQTIDWFKIKTIIYLVHFSQSTGIYMPR